MSRVVAWEGLDRSGKTTTMKKYAVQSKQEFATLDRFTTSCRVYHRFFGRANNTKFFDRLEHQLATEFGLVVVFMDTEPTICFERGAEYTVEELCKQRQLFIDELQALELRTLARVVYITTNNRPTEELVEECLRRI